MRWRPTSTSLGEMIHMAQSLVGKVLSSWDMTPPMPALFSTMWTKNPEFARSRVACIPAIPPPTTRTDPMGFDVMVTSRDWWFDVAKGSESDSA